MLVPRYPSDRNSANSQRTALAAVDVTVSKAIAVLLGCPSVPERVPMEYAVHRKNALAKPPKLTKAQKELGAIMRGDA